MTGIHRKYLFENMSTLFQLLQLCSGLRLPLTAPPACSEEPACWDDDCDLCYDPLRQEHAQCPRALTVHSCSSLPLACRPFLCWPKDENITSQSTTVLLRDFKRSLGAC